MKASSIRNHLAVYAMVAKRKTTISHMFASAIAPVDDYVEAELREGLALLDQDIEAGLLCVYCDDPAETWDHLRALVQNRQFSGYGHQLGNLVPSCKRCNSRKGNRAYDEYIRVSSASGDDAKGRIQKITTYSTRFLPNPMPQDEYARRWPAEMAALESLRGQIIQLMTQADEVAGNLRRVAKEHSEGHRNGSEATRARDRAGHPDLPGEPDPGER